VEFSRIIGKRKVPGDLPGTISDREIFWMNSMNQYTTCIPKGIFRYRSHEDANVDMDKWIAMAMAKAMIEGRNESR